MLDVLSPSPSPFALHDLAAQGFLFATGIENSAPTIEGGRHRRDQMAECGHYDRWKEDLALVKAVGCGVLRYGPQLHITLRAPGLHDWSFADESFAEIRRLGILPVVDLCHFGVPDFIGDFQNPDFPELFADYAGAFAARFPWVQLYTPVNEMFITAVFSAKYGWRN
jgi:beta-glucosidase